MKIFRSKKIELEDEIYDDEDLQKLSPRSMVQPQSILH